MAASSFALAAAPRSLAALPAAIAISTAAGTFFIVKKASVVAKFFFSVTASMATAS
jgi:hypothetical protein